MEEGNTNVNNITADELAELLRNIGINAVQPVFETPKNEDQTLTDIPDSFPNNASSYDTLSSTEDDSQLQNLRSAPKNDLVKPDDVRANYLSSQDTIPIVRNINVQIHESTPKIDLIKLDGVHKNIFCNYQSGSDTLSSISTGDSQRNGSKIFRTEPDEFQIYEDSVNTVSSISTGDLSNQSQGNGSKIFRTEPDEFQIYEDSVNTVSSISTGDLSNQSQGNGSKIFRTEPDEFQIYEDSPKTISSISTGDLSNQSQGNGSKIFRTEPDEFQIYEDSVNTVSSISTGDLSNQSQKTAPKIDLIKLDGVRRNLFDDYVSSPDTLTSTNTGDSQRNGSKICRTEPDELQIYEDSAITISSISTGDLSNQSQKTAPKIDLIKLDGVRQNLFLNYESSPDSLASTSTGDSQGNGSKICRTKPDGIRPNTFQIYENSLGKKAMKKRIKKKKIVKRKRKPKSGRTRYIHKNIKM